MPVWLHGHVIPEQIAVGKVKEAFDDDGNLIDDTLMERVTNLAKSLVKASIWLAKDSVD